MITANGLANEDDFIEDEKVSRLCVLPDPARASLVTLNPEFSVTSKSAVVLKLHTLRHVPISDAKKECNKASSLRIFFLRWLSFGELFFTIYSLYFEFQITLVQCYDNTNINTTSIIQQWQRL